MERLTLLFYRRINACILRFMNIGAVLRREPSSSGLGRFAYAFEALLADTAKSLAGRWGINTGAMHRVRRLVMQPKSCEFVDRTWCSPQLYSLGGPVDAWEPDVLPKLYSLANCCADSAFSPLLVVMPLPHYAGPTCVPQLGHSIPWGEEGIQLGNVQGLEMCYSQEALAHMDPTLLWASRGNLSQV